MKNYKVVSREAHIDCIAHDSCPMTLPYLSA